ncbi:PASTA domain-containing penicillin-binding protein [uncultured Acetobacterium sp.]|uniref:PASTA domain-containing penicillin-binding protein n=1 Tax=uncultured Acetobacterium sp. TaxID=217139 RepID=UPI0025E04671|nr:PASTA domain-containing penicillin-binding protein [uncultured Acetobacterium sp.]
MNIKKKAQREIGPVGKQNRIMIAMVVLSLCLIVVIGKLFSLQIVNSTGKYERQVDQLVEEVPIKASRGDIYDRNKNVLAKDSSATAVNVIPYEVEDPERLARTLSSKLGVKIEDVQKKITVLENDIVEVKTGISQGAAAIIGSHNFEGVSIVDGTLYFIPIKIKDPGAVASAISKDLDYNYEALYARATRKENQPVLIMGKVDNALALEIKESEAIIGEDGEIDGYNGVELLDDYRRYYTNGNFASYILGFTGRDYSGLYGVESTYEDVLSGEDGVVYFQKDANGNQIPSQTKILKEPVQGEDIVLTIDSNIQLMAEKAVKEAATTWKTKSVTAIVMETKTGEVVAMATTPDYNLNDPFTLDANFAATHAEDLAGKTEQEQLAEMYKNQAVSFIYEPGSTFKALTGAAALEEGVMTPDTVVYCEGRIQIGDAVINCATGPHGSVTVSDAIAYSCNPGLVQIIEKLNPDVFYQYVYNFGLGERTGIALDGEEAGIVNRLSTATGGINEVDYATFSFGQGLAVTPIQIISALNSVVNDGYYVKPTVISAETTGKPIESQKQIISKETSAATREIMRKVVGYDSDMTALSEGYSVGGKTGTAEKFINGEYSRTKYVTSFYCFAPVEDPKYSVYVVLDEPAAGAYGSTSAAPTAISLIKQALNYNSADTTLGGAATQEIQKGNITVPDLVGQNIDFAASILNERGINYVVDPETSGATVAAQSLPTNSVYDPNSELILALGETDSAAVGTVIVPDLKGLSIQSANEILTGLGLNLKITGNGFASSQTPAATTVVEIGSDVNVTFTP